MGKVTGGKRRKLCKGIERDYQSWKGRGGRGKVGKHVKRGGGGLKKGAMLAGREEAELWGKKKRRQWVTLGGGERVGREARKRPRGEVAGGGFESSKKKERKGEWKRGRSSGTQGEKAWGGFRTGEKKSGLWKERSISNSFREGVRKRRWCEKKGV